MGALPTAAQLRAWSATEAASTDAFAVDQARVAADYAEFVETFDAFLAGGIDEAAHHFDLATVFPKSLLPETARSVRNTVKDALTTFVERLADAAMEVAPERLADDAADDDATGRRGIEAWAHQLYRCHRGEDGVTGAALAVGLRAEAVRLAEAALARRRAAQRATELHAVQRALHDWERHCSGRADGAGAGSARRRWHARFTRDGAAHSWRRVSEALPALGAALAEAAGGLAPDQLRRASPEVLEALRRGLGRDGAAAAAAAACQRCANAERWILERPPTDACFGGLVAVVGRADAASAEARCVAPPHCFGALRGGNQVYVEPARRGPPHYWALPGVRWRLLLATVLEADALPFGMVGGAIVRRCASIEREEYATSLRRMVADTLEPHARRTGQSLWG